MATVVGETPGCPATLYYGVIKIYSSPHSHVIFHATFKKFYRPDPAKNPIRFTPDILVKAEDAMNEVYKLIKNKYKLS